MATEVNDRLPVTSMDFLDAFNEETPDDKKEPEIKLEEDDKEEEDELPLAPVRSKGKDKESEEEPEIEDDEEEEEEEPEINLENEDEIELARIPRRAEIKAAFPDFFKKFPQVEHALHREKQFSELFPKLEDAKQAHASLDDYNAFQSELFNGDIKGLLRALKKSDEGAYTKLTDNLLENVAAVDPAANLKIANKITRSILKILDTNSKNIENEDDREQLQIAIRLVNRAIYGSTKIEDPPSSSNRQEDPREKELNDREARFQQERYQTTYNEVGARMKTMLNKAVARDIDPKGIVPTYVKGKLVDDVLAELDKQLLGDTRFKNLVSSLWADAHKNGYSKDKVEKIVETLKRKSQAMLPPIMRAKKEQALKGLMVRRREEKKDDDIDENPVNDGEKREPRKRATSNRQDGNDRLKMRDGESAMDFFARD